MHPGKEKCELLKSIRVKLAEANGIEYTPAECTHEGPCEGSCPLCDQELHWLDMQIFPKLGNGEDVTFDVLTEEEQDLFFGAADELEYRLNLVLDETLPKIPEPPMGIPAHLYGDERDVYVLRSPDTGSASSDEGQSIDAKNNQD